VLVTIYNSKSEGNNMIVSFRGTNLAALAAPVAMTASGAAPAAVSEIEGSEGEFLNDKTLLGVESICKPGNLKSVGLSRRDIGAAFAANRPNRTLTLLGTCADCGQMPHPFMVTRAPCTCGFRQQFEHFSTMISEENLLKCDIWVADHPATGDQDNV
jgi:hypothetical protein